MSIQSNFPNLKPSLLLDFANTKQLDNRVTFTRSTPAVYYDGRTTAMAEQNLFTYSQEFDNAAWSKTLAPITANATTAPDGTSTADLAVANTTDGDHSVVQLFSFADNATLTISCYMKAAGYNYGVLRHYSVGNGDVWASFNLSTGAVDSNSSGVTASITSIGNGWYRCVMTKTYSSATSGNSYGVRVANAGGIGTPFVGNGTSGIYIWGAQLENRASATAYTATTTQPITNYIPVLLTAGGNQARFDCNPTTGESLGLLIEEQRTNLALYSEDFSYYTGSGSITVNQGIAPNGTQTADLITGTSDIYQTLVGSSSGTYSLSMYVRSITAPYFMLSFGYPSVQRVVFNLSNGSVSSTVGTNITGSSISVGNNWYRLTIVGISQGSILYNQFNAYASTTYNDKTTGALIWGAQLEQGAFPTSYIATTSASATRTADAASMTGTNFSTWYSINGGSLYAAYRIAFTSGNRYLLSIDQNNNNYVEINGNSTTNRSQLYNRVGGTLDVAISGSTPVSLTSVNQIAIAVANNDFALYLNGTSQGTDTSATLAPTLSSLEIGRYNEGSPSGYLNGTIAKIAYYPIRVTNAQMQALTS